MPTELVIEVVVALVMLYAGFSAGVNYAHWRSKK